MDERKLGRGLFTDTKDITDIKDIKSTPRFFTLSLPLEYTLFLAANNHEPVVCLLETLVLPQLHSVLPCIVLHIKPTAHPVHVMRHPRQIGRNTTPC